MLVSHKVGYFITAITQIVGLLTFMKGFFPIKPGVPGLSVTDDVICISERNESCVQSVAATFDRMIFVLIDALRADFVLPDFDGSKAELPRMKFVYDKILKNESISFISRAHPPTVTMPRIKAITSGGIPGFIDVVLNFNSKELSEDNFIHQLRRSGKKLVFYGDDTWLKLFPNHFIRSEGTTSFFVSDYSEVDHNVTRHIDSEMLRHDWDVLMLHYLGLDHIGHLAGPRSPLVEPKLVEMDGIIYKLYNLIKKRDRKERTSTLLVLCGDHGMSEQGSHGGSTQSETGTPVVFLSPAFEKGGGRPFESKEILQIDITPSISMFLGLPNPKNNLGVLPSQILETLDIRDRLTAAYENCQQILGVLKSFTGLYDREESFHLFMRAKKAHSEWFGMEKSSSSFAKKISDNYRQSMLMMRKTIASSISSYDLYAISLGISIIWFAFILNICLWCLQKGTRRTHRYFNIDLNNPTVVLAFGLGVLLLPAFHLTVCTSIHKSDFLCDSTFPNIFAPILALLFTFVPVLCILGCNFRDLTRSFSWDHKQLSFRCIFLWIGTILHTITLLASSFVEEEHQTWYFLTTSVIFILIIDRACMNTPKKSGNGKYQMQISTSEIVATSLMLLCHRLSRSWNRTGDKWAHLPDIGGLLVEPENKFYLSLCVLLSLAIVCGIAWKELSDLLSKLIFISCCMCIYTFRAANGSLLFPKLYSEHFKGTGLLEARLAWSLIISLVIYLVVRRRKMLFLTPKNCSQIDLSSKRRYDFATGIHYTWVLIILLLMRPHNICLTSLMLTQYYLYSSYLEKLLPSNALLSLLFVWSGQASFFFQGNSNSISTVDVSAGYVGLETFNPSLVGILMIFSTYAGPVFWIIALLRLELKKSLLKSQYFYFTENLFSLLMTRSLPLSVYVILITIQRHHLFVWSVFSPKLLYEGMMTAVFSTFSTFFMFL